MKLKTCENIAGAGAGNDRDERNTGKASDSFPVFAKRKVVARTPGNEI
ncbi:MULTISPECIES: hypothetical protein [unclassified Candidatus Paralachnospira]